MCCKFYLYFGNKLFLANNCGGWCRADRAGCLLRSWQRLFDLLLNESGHYVLASTELHSTVWLWAVWAARERRRWRCLESGWLITLAGVSSAWGARRRGSETAREVTRGWWRLLSSFLCLDFHTANFLGSFQHLLFRFFFLCLWKQNKKKRWNKSSMYLIIVI